MMRTVAGLVLVTIIIDLSLAVRFEDVKIKLGKRDCTCTFTVVPKEPCTVKAKCDKKCGGKGMVEVEGYELDMQCKKGKCDVLSCQEGGAVTVAPIGSGSEPGPATGSGSGPATGSGSGPMPPTGSGSGATPLPITGSGSGEEPVPITGTGTGSGSGMPPMPPTGESMPCSCQCSCPEGGAACDCDCNCPVRSPMIYCGSGFTKVCPMMEDRCPDMMMEVCPDMMMPMPMPLTRSAKDRMSHEGEGCQCVPDFLLAMVPGMPAPGTPVAGRSATNRAAVPIKFGKRPCKCEVDCKCKNGSCDKSKITCDKKCSGTAKAVPIEGCGIIDAKAKNGKVKISSCTCGGEEPTGTGSGSGPTEPTTGSGSGPGPTLPTTGSGSGGGPMPMPRCACVGMM